MQHVELDRIARRETADGAGEFAGILDRFAIDAGDDVAGLDAGLGRRAIGCGSATSAPSAFFMPRLSAISDVTGWIWTPIQPRLTEPLSLSWAITLLTVEAGIENAMPTLPPDGE